jgi:hypothetical protein
MVAVNPSAEWAQAHTAKQVRSLYQREVPNVWTRSAHGTVSEAIDREVAPYGERTSGGRRMNLLVNHINAPLLFLLHWSRNGASPILCFTFLRNRALFCKDVVLLVVLLLPLCGSTRSAVSDATQIRKTHQRVPYSNLGVTLHVSIASTVRASSSSAL